MLIKPQTTNFAKIRVMGVGGGGSNALNSMISQSTIQGVDFIAVNTDAQSLLLNQAATKLQKVMRGKITRNKISNEIGQMETQIAGIENLVQTIKQ